MRKFDELRKAWQDAAAAKEEAVIETRIARAVYQEVQSPRTLDAYNRAVEASNAAFYAEQAAFDAYMNAPIGEANAAPLGGDVLHEVETETAASEPDFWETAAAWQEAALLVESMSAPAATQEEAVIALRQQLTRDGLSMDDATFERFRAALDAALAAYNVAYRAAHPYVSALPGNHDPDGEWGECAMCGRARHIGNTTTCPCQWGAP